MNVKVYLNDWFYNCGIIGFINILESNKEEYKYEDISIIKENNYIEFNTKILKNFHKYYFNYFFKQQNIAQKMNDKINESFNKIKNLLSDDDKIKENKEKIASEEKYIKSTIKVQMDKIKKFDLQTYENISNEVSLIEKVKEKNQLNKLDNIKENIIKELSKEEINSHLTLNSFKSILSNSFFGQQSYLNVVNSNKTFGEQEDIFYKDYISNIIATDFLNEIINDKYNLDEIKAIIQEKLQNEKLSKEVEKYYNNIIKQYLNKNKNLAEIKTYIKEKIFYNCELCGNESGMTSDYTEGNFIQLAISSQNMQNVFWNQNVKFPICDICKLILLCIPAGTTMVSKTIKEYSNGKVQYKEKNIYSFVNMDTNINKLLLTNKNFKENSKNENKYKNPYSDLILDITKQNKEITKWELQNIYVVEFEAKYQKFSRMKYFNLKKYFIEFIRKYSENTLDKINNSYLKLEIMDALIKDNDLRRNINDKLYESMQDNSTISRIDIYLTNRIETIINILKKGGIEMENTSEQIELANKKIHVMFTLGNEIYQKLKMEGNDNKLNGFIYKMLNSIKVNQKDRFTDTAIRLIWMADKDVPEILVKNNEEVNWIELGHSFISGLTQSKYEGKKGGLENE